MSSAKPAGGVGDGDIDGDFLAAANLITPFNRESVDEDTSLINPFLDLRTTTFRQLAAKEVIQAVMMIWFFRNESA